MYKIPCTTGSFCKVFKSSVIYFAFLVYNILSLYMELKFLLKCNCGDMTIMVLLYFALTDGDLLSMVG